jgi:hypothetical protein
MPAQPRQYLSQPDRFAGATVSRGHLRRLVWPCAEDSDPDCSTDHCRFTRESALTSRQNVQTHSLPGRRRLPSRAMPAGAGTGFASGLRENNRIEHCRWFCFRRQCSRREEECDCISTDIWVRNADSGWVPVLKSASPIYLGAHHETRHRP